MTGILCALLGGAPDTNPDAFSFTNATGIEPSTLTTSNTITPVGYAAQAIWSVTNGGTASINGGAYASSGTISPGQTITVRGTSSSSYSTTVSFVVSIGTTQSTWGVTTRAQPTEASYTTPGTYSFIVPSFVTSVSVVCVAAGGGVGILGQGASGVNGTDYSGAGGQGGSGGASGGGGGGSGPGYAGSGGSGGLYGGAGGRQGDYGNYYYPYDGGFGSVGNGVGGAVRIIWPGNTRLFPSTNTGVI